MIAIPHRHRRTDGETTCLGNTALYLAVKRSNNQYISIHTGVSVNDPLDSDYAECHLFVITSVSA